MQATLAALIEAADSNGILPDYTHTWLVKTMGRGPAARRDIPNRVRALAAAGVIHLVPASGGLTGRVVILDWDLLSEARDGGATGARGGRDGGAELARDGGATGARGGRDGGAEFERLASDHALSLDFELHGWMDEEIPTSNGLASVPPLRTGRRSTDEEVDQAVEVLLELCRNWGLPATILGPGYPILGRLAADELERLARRTCQRVRQFDGTKDKIRNPLGWAIDRIKLAEDQWWAAAPGAQAPAAALDPARPLTGEVQGPGRSAEPTEPMLDGVAAAEMVRRLRDPYRGTMGEAALVGASGES